MAGPCSFLISLIAVSVYFIYGISIPTVKPENHCLTNDYLMHPLPYKNEVEK